jgi:hypothetical protein
MDGQMDGWIKGWMDSAWCKYDSPFTQALLSHFQLYTHWPDEKSQDSLLSSAWLIKKPHYESPLLSTLLSPLLSSTLYANHASTCSHTELTVALCPVHSHTLDVGDVTQSLWSVHRYYYCTPFQRWRKSHDPDPYLPVSKTHAITKSDGGPLTSIWLSPKVFTNHHIQKHQWHWMWKTAKHRLCVQWMDGWPA